MLPPNNYPSQNDLHTLQKQSWVQMPLPSRHDLGRFCLWALGRTCIGVLQVGNLVARSSLQNLVALSLIIEKGLQALVAVYDGMPFMGAPLATLSASTARDITHSSDNIHPIELLDSITGKHVLIVGDTGSGKSTIAQYIAKSLAGTVKVYDPDATPVEWDGLPVTGRGADFDSIDTAMADDLLEMTDRITARATTGDSANAGKELCIIAEEFPLLKDECSMSGEWLGKIARRGRKPKMLLCILSQSDTVQALGIEGDGAIRQNFRYVRLGRFALTHAKSLKNTVLTEWLKGGKYRCMVDDEPCQLPDMNAYRTLTPSPLFAPFTKPVLTSETRPQQTLQPENATTEVTDTALKNAVKSLLDAGVSQSHIIQNVLGYSGRRYAEGKEIIAKIISEK